LTRLRSFKIANQVQSVAALLILHNILVNIREVEDPGETIVASDYLELELPKEDLSLNASGDGYWIRTAERARTSRRRNQIAQDMWDAY
jgi:hypothetical protein